MPKDLIDRLESVSRELADTFGELNKAECDGGLTEDELQVIIVSFGRCLKDIKTMMAMREITRRGGK